MNHYTYDDYLRAAQAIRARMREEPEFLLILGSGLGFIGDLVRGATVIPYADIPGFCPSTAPGHKGMLVFGSLCGKRVMIMQGRMHRYEGYTPRQIGFPVRVAKLLGAKSMIVTNAAGILNTDFNIGELMLISDYLNFSQASPLEGPNIPEFGVRFPDVGNVFDKGYRALAREAAAGMGLTLREGVYCNALGPQYESHAEIRAFRMLGGDAVGMSTVPESITAAHCGIKTLGISLLCNYAAGITDAPVTEEEVLEAAERAKPYFSQLVMEFLKRA